LGISHVCSIILFFSSSGDHRDLHSFPTRRSSDLPDMWYGVPILKRHYLAEGMAKFALALFLGRPAILATHHRFFRQGTGRKNLRSEEHTSELQSRENLVCRLLLEKKNKSTQINTI